MRCVPSSTIQERSEMVWSILHTNQAVIPDRIRENQLLQRRRRMDWLTAAVLSVHVSIVLGRCIGFAVKSGGGEHILAERQNGPVSRWLPLYLSAVCPGVAPKCAKESIRLGYLGVKSLIRTWSSGSHCQVNSPADKGTTFAPSIAQR
jgi:hypothetical protein